MDLRTLSAEDFAQHLQDVLAEEKRRLAIATIPASVATLARTYTEGGGDLADLTAAITAPTPEEPTP